MLTRPSKYSCVSTFAAFHSQGVSEAQLDYDDAFSDEYDYDDNSDFGQGTHGHCVAQETEGNDDGEQLKDRSSDSDDSTDDGDDCDAYIASDQSHSRNERAQQVHRAELPPRHAS